MTPTESAIQGRVCRGDKVVAGVLIQPLQLAPLPITQSAALLKANGCSKIECSVFCGAPQYRTTKTYYQWTGLQEALSEGLVRAKASETSNATTQALRGAIITGGGGSDHGAQARKTKVKQS